MYTCDAYIHVGLHKKDIYMYHTPVKHGDYRVLYAL